MASVIDTGAIPAAAPESAPAGRVTRHAGVDRLFHWLTAASVLTLMGTALLPILGLKFDWVAIHWIAGVVLIALTLFHILRALIWQRLKTMFWVSGEELGRRQVGKYSVAQKLMHYAMTFMVLAAALTGALMLMKMNTPWWHRDPYRLSQATWGVIYVIHVLAALSAVTLVMIHIYFGVIPRNRMYLRAMIRGWITRQELLEHHDAHARKPE
jgi:cytochrome b subunit of formate dehydrogenase